MAQSLEAATGKRPAVIALPKSDEIIDFLDRDGESAAVDPSYGETLSGLLPRRLSELTRRH
jgi:hypothetical protein